MREFLTGIRLLREALSEDAPILSVWIREGNRLPPDVYRQLRARGIPLHRVPEERLRALSGTQASRLTVLTRIAPLSLVDPDTLIQHLQATRGLAMALDGVQDTGNAGNLARSLAFFGGVGIFWPTRRTVPLTQAVLDRSRGALRHLLVARTPNLRETLRAFQEEGGTVWALETGGEPLHRLTPRRPLVLVVGDEHRGIRRPLLRMADAVVSIPGTGRLPSLNVASAGAIALHWIAVHHGT